MRVFIRLLVLLMATLARAQSPASAPSTLQMDLSDRCIADMPADWVRASDFVVRNGFLQRTGSELTGAFHRQGTRPTDLPYVLLEHFPLPPNATQADQEASAEIVRSYYLTSLRPPSKADRAAGWKRANVTPVVYDFAKGTFSFHATIHFDSGGDYQIDVRGIFDTYDTLVVSAWSDANSTADAATLASILDSVRYATPRVPTMSFQQKLVRTAKIAGVLLVLLVVGIQLYVLVRERRQRREEALAIERMLE